MLTFPEIQKQLDEIGAGYEHLNLQNLEVTIKLETPVSFMGFFYLEGILQYQILVNLLGSDFFNLDKNEGLTIPLPLKWHGSKMKFPACSVAQYEGAEGITRWRKRWDSQFDDVVDFGKKKNRVEHKMGHFKCYDMPLVYHTIPDGLKFYLVGNAAVIDELLSSVVSIGKKRSQGFGKIQKVLIDEIKEDWSTAKDGVLMRPLPVEEISLFSSVEAPIIQMGYKPPYYWPENITFCFVPGGKVTL